MKVSHKIVIIALFVLLTISALSVITGPVKAQTGTLNFTASISSNSSTVGQDASYTFTINNVGTPNLGDANITIPKGYSNVGNLVITQQPASENWTINMLNNYILLSSSNQGLSSGQKITFTFNAKNPPPSGNYVWVVGSNENTGSGSFSAPEFTYHVSDSIIISTVLAASMIFFIATVIAFLNTGLNRVLINYFVGWEQYRVMQKEMNEYRSETMAAMRANDKKQVEKLKKRESQIKNMQAKMMKPQMVQFGFSFVYIIIWFLVLTPTFGTTSMVYVPGFGRYPCNLLVPHLLVLLRSARITLNRHNAD